MPNNTSLDAMLLAKENVSRGLDHDTKEPAILFILVAIFWVLVAIYRQKGE